MREKVIALNRNMNGWLIPAVLLPIWVLTYLNLQNLADYLIDDIFGMASKQTPDRNITIFHFRGS